MSQRPTAERIRHFGEHSCRGQSPLYEAICRGLADDEDLVELASATPDGQPVPNLILAAVHYLLLQGAQHELRRAYPSCGGGEQSPERACEAFRGFCRSHDASIRQLLMTRRVQTNEVRRSAYLLPAFAHVSRELEGRPLALIEVGASSGMLLNWDRYRYEYGKDAVIGSGAVSIASEWRGESAGLPADVPQVSERVGVDIHPIDIRDENEALWLRSLIWPDQPERMQLLTAAIAEFQRHPCRLIAGDGREVLPRLVDSMPEQAAVCVFHCHTLNQLSDQGRQEFKEVLRDSSKRRPLTQISAEWIYTKHPELRMIRWDGGDSMEELLAEVDHHGRWIDWKSS